MTRLMAAGLRSRCRSPTLKDGEAVERLGKCGELSGLPHLDLAALLPPRP